MKEREVSAYDPEADVLDAHGNAHWWDGARFTLCGQDARMWTTVVGGGDVDCEECQRESKEMGL